MADTIFQIRILPHVSHLCHTFITLLSHFLYSTLKGPLIIIAKSYNLCEFVHMLVNMIPVLEIICRRYKAWVYQSWKIVGNMKTWGQKKCRRYKSWVSWNFNCRRFETWIVGNMHCRRYKRTPLCQMPKIRAQSSTRDLFYDTPRHSTIVLLLRKISHADKRFSVSSINFLKMRCVT